MTSGVTGTRRVSHRARRLLAAALVACLPASIARGDGAFPDSQTLIAPADEPARLVLATNFGLISTEDGAQTWTWICEQPGSKNGSLYQLGPSPRRRLFTVAEGTLGYSDDRGCTWKTATGLVADTAVLDAFADPLMADRVWAVAVSASNNGSAAIYLSQDGGARFDKRVYAAREQDVISGVESARSEPDTVYATISRANAQGFVPALVRSHDGGATWQDAPLTGLGAGSIRLIAVDPATPTRLLLRWHTNDGEHLALTTDAGDTARSTLDLPGGVLSSFARLGDGRLFLGGVLGVDPVLYVSSDGGATWKSLPNPPHLRALASRGGTLYGATDNVADGFAVAISNDGGVTWNALTRFEDVQAIATCVKSVCEDACYVETDLSVWSDQVCTAAAMPAATDGGTSPGTGGASGQDAGPGSKKDGGPDAASVPVGGTKSGGCACALDPRQSPSRPFATRVVLASALGSLVTLYRRRRRGSPR